MNNSSVRIEFGVERVSCGCKACTDACRFLPSFLIPSDLERLIPTSEDPLTWAEAHLLSSPGATLFDPRTSKIREVPTLILASKSNDDPSCIFLNRNNKCSIHEISPFGCAFFKVCQPLPTDQTLSVVAHLEIEKEFNKTPDSLYKLIWVHLYRLGKRALPLVERWKRMDDALARERR